MKNIDIEKIVRLSKADWLKLEAWTDKLAYDVEEMIAPGFYSHDDVKSEIRLAYMKLGAIYKPGAMSLTSYIWKYAAKWTASKLSREIAKLPLSIEQRFKEWTEEHGEDDDLEPDLDDGRYKSLAEHLDESDLVDQVQKIADQNGLGKIAKLLKTMTEREIAEELCQTHQAIHKKIEKLRRLCAKLK